MALRGENGGGEWDTLVSTGADLNASPLPIRPMRLDGE